MILFCSDLGCHLRIGDETFAPDSWKINVLTLVADFSKYSDGHKSESGQLCGNEQILYLVVHG